MSEEDNSPSASSKKLKYSEPDLEVVVGEGENQKTFECYAAILSSYSEYIDTLLSANMQEREAMKITFPEITPEIWERLMAFLQPGGSECLTVTDGHDFLPFCHKYDFRPALSILDKFFLPLLTSFMEPEADYDVSIVTTASLCFKHDLLQCKPKAVECAERMFTWHAGKLDENGVRSLVPLIQDSRRTLTLLALHTHPRPLNLTREERAAFTLEDSFPSKFLSRRAQIDQQVDLFQRLKLNRIEVLSAGSDNANGEYSLVPVGATDCDNLKLLGMMHWAFGMEVARDGGLPPSYMRLSSFDPFGYRWDLDYNEEGETKTLYTWRSDDPSLVPPNHGWSVGEHGSAPVPQIRCHYD